MTNIRDIMTEEQLEREFDSIRKVFEGFIETEKPLRIEWGTKDAFMLSEAFAQQKTVKQVTVRWFDGYLEEFECEAVRFGSDLLWLKLKDGKNRHIPTREVRWYSIYPESHEKEVK